MWPGLLWVLQRISPNYKSVEKSFNENGVTFLLDDMTLSFWWKMSYLSWIQCKSKDMTFWRPFNHNVILWVKIRVFPVFASGLKFWNSERPTKGELTLGVLFRTFLIESPSIQLRLSLKKNRTHLTFSLPYYRSM